jgi:hypothetical protein
VNAAAHDGGGQPVPPALASQVQSMVYGGMHVGNPNDPLLTWSSSMRDQAAMVPGGVVPMQHAPAAAAAPQAQPAAMPVQAMPMQPIAMPAQPIAPQAPRMVPAEPPAGAYGAAPAAVPADPFLARAEQGGGDVSFG